MTRKSTHQQLQEARNLWIERTRGALRATPTQMRQLNAKIARLTQQLVAEHDAQHSAQEG